MFELANPALSLIETCRPDGTIKTIKNEYSQHFCAGLLAPIPFGDCNTLSLFILHRF